MNTLLDPNLIFISEDDWSIVEVRDKFLDNLVNHLEIINNYVISKFIWSDQLEILLWSYPQLRPWRKDKAWSTTIIPYLYKNFSKNNQLIKTEDYNKDIQVNPIIKFDLKPSMLDEYCKIFHYFISENECFYFCVSSQNRSNSYRITCDCHENEICPEIVFQCCEWYKYIDYNKLFIDLLLNEDFSKINDLLNYFAIYKNIKTEDERFIYNFSFEKNFINSIIHCDTVPVNLLKNIVSRLMKDQPKASGDNSLNDEPVRNTNGRVRRFKTSHDSRIHYKYDSNGDIIFLLYYPSGHHDDGL